MYLGDDDFIECAYLKEILEHLEGNTNVHCVIPSFVPINILGEHLVGGRDFNLPNKTTKRGFYNCFINSWRGHQLSGLVLKRAHLYDSYVARKVNNIYLFIYFVAQSCLDGDTYHFTKYPVKVTQPGQENKDWGYGKDGLLNEVFDNYKKLSINYLQKSVLQLFFYAKQPGRLFMFRQAGIKPFFRAFLSICFTSNSTFLFKICFPFTVVFVYLYYKIRII